MLAHLPAVEGVRALDLASGTGRYADILRTQGAAVVSLDYSMEMLRRSSAGVRLRADMLKLPFVSDAFGAVVSGLAVGHAPDLSRWMREIARVMSANGTLLYSDFHPAAAAAGMTRTFTDADNRKHTLAHHPHALEAHRDAAERTGLVVEYIHEVRVGIEMQEDFPGAEAFYRRWSGLPVVLVVRARKQ